MGVEGSGRRTSSQLPLSDVFHPQYLHVMTLGGLLLYTRVCYRRTVAADASDIDLVAMNAETGKVVWRSQPLLLRGSSRPVVTASHEVIAYDCQTQNLVKFMVRKWHMLSPPPPPLFNSNYHTVAAACAPHGTVPVRRVHQCGCLW